MLFRDEEEQQPARQLAESERFLSPSASSSTSMTRLVDGESAPTQTVLELGAEWASGVELIRMSRSI